MDKTLSEMNFELMVLEKRLDEAQDEFLRLKSERSKLWAVIRNKKKELGVYVPNPLDIWNK